VRLERSDRGFSNQERSSVTTEFPPSLGMLPEGSGVLAKSSERSAKTALDVHSSDLVDVGGAPVKSSESRTRSAVDAHSTEVINLGAPIVPTQETYAQLQEAYDYLNRHLVENKLPNCLITLQRHKGTYGYFAPKRFGRKDGQRTDEIALNPQHFREGTEEILSTLAHEMVHMWQHHFGKPGRGRYHNSKWAAKMRHIGLHPSDTGKEGGKQTGDSVSHYIVAGGPFARAVKKLLDGGFEITWAEVKARERSSSGDGAGQDGDGSSLSGKRTKFTCPQCDLNAWAKAGAELLCGKDSIKMEPANKAAGQGRHTDN
jgi:hypothetical protein